MESAKGKLVEWVCGKIIIPLGYKTVFKWEPGTLAAWNTKQDSVDIWDWVLLEEVFSQNLIYIAPIKQQEVEHPPLYGGEQDPYEAIKVIEAWSLGFNLGNLLKYVCRAEEGRGAETRRA